MTTLALHLLLIMIEYKPPSIDNLRYLIKGGHPSLRRIFNYFLQQVTKSSHKQLSPQELETQSEAIFEDLTINEHYRLLRVVQGKINLDPLYTGIS